MNDKLRSAESKAESSTALTADGTGQLQFGPRRNQIRCRPAQVVNELHVMAGTSREVVSPSSHWRHDHRSERRKFVPEYSITASPVHQKHNPTRV